MVNGYRREKDVESRERWTIMRRLMFAAMWGHAKQGFTESQICIFPWEEKAHNNFTIEENEKLVADVEKVKAFWAKVDAKKINNA